MTTKSVTNKTGAPPPAVDSLSEEQQVATRKLELFKMLASKINEATEGVIEFHFQPPGPYNFEAKKDMIPYDDVMSGKYVPNIKPWENKSYSPGDIFIDGYPIRVDITGKRVLKIGIPSGTYGPLTTKPGEYNWYVIVRDSIKEAERYKAGAEKHSAWEKSCRERELSPVEYAEKEIRRKLDSIDPKRIAETLTTRLMSDLVNQTRISIASYYLTPEDVKPDDLYKLVTDALREMSTSIQQYSERMQADPSATMQEYLVRIALKPEPKKDEYMLPPMLINPYWMGRNNYHAV